MNEELDTQDALYLWTSYEEEPEVTTTGAQAPGVVVEAILMSMEGIRERQGKKADKPLLIWEMFVDRGSFSQACQDYCAERGDEVIVQQFSLQNGWGLRWRKNRKNLLEKLEMDKPDHVFLAPPCTPWSAMLRIRIASVPGYAGEIARERKNHEATSSNSLQLL